MKISYYWLTQLLPGLTLSPEEVARLLTAHSFETVVREKRELDPRITVVRVEQLEPHLNADRLRLATVTDGTQSIRVVCGAPNVAVGQLVPFSPPGTTLRDEAGKAVVLKTSTIRGVESPGMLNSAREIGVGTSHAGIFVLPPDTPLGARLVDHLPNDTLLEAEINPNRAHDCLGHLGIARELAALTTLPLKESSALFDWPAKKSDWTVTIADAHATPRYLGAIVRDVHNGPSPLWLQAQLLTIGARPINAVVDITNYVMFETGNPIHAFDAQRLPGKEMSVRFARRGEQFVTLDEAVHDLTEEMLVITSDDIPVALAGVMGGKSSEVTTTTHDLFIEVANFEPYTIQKTVQSLGLRTEAAARWIKGIDPNMAVVAMARTLWLLQELTQAVVDNVSDTYADPRVPPSIAFRPDQVSLTVGRPIVPEVSRQALEALRCTVSGTKTWKVTPPSERLDLNGEHELIEEVIRMIGLENIQSEAPVADPRALPSKLLWREALRDLLVSWGFSETYNYSFEPALWAEISAREQKPLSLLNPISPEQKNLRRSLLPALVGNLAHNMGEFRIQQLFEIGSVYWQGDGGIVPGAHEERHIAGVLFGGSQDQTKVEIIVARILTTLGITDVHSIVGDQQPWGAGMLQIRHGSEVLGNFGQLDPMTTADLKTKEPVLAFELNLDRLSMLATSDAPQTFPSEGANVQYVPYSKYPPVFRDVSLLVAPEVQIEDVQAIIERVGGTLVVDVDLFDVYQPSLTELRQAGTQPSGEEAGKSLAFHIKYQSSDKTLTDDEVALLHNQIVRALQEELGAKMRG